MEILDKISDIGLVREKNEDVAFFLRHPKNKDIILLAVADGMGGKDHGEIAANYTINEIAKWFKKKDATLFEDSPKCISLLKRLIKKIHNNLIKTYHENNVGTTLTLTIKTKMNTIVINIGDSRAYIYKDKKLIQITEDDSDVWLYFKYDNVNKEDLRYFSTSNLINACIGLNDKLLKISTNIIKNDYEIILLLTDGVTDLLTDKKMTNIIKTIPKEKILNTLIYEAVNVDQRLSVPSHLKEKKLNNYIVPFKGRDNASGVIYIKE